MSHRPEASDAVGVHGSGPPGPFPVEWYRDRRRRVAEALGGEVLLLGAAPIRTRAGDSEYRYRPDPDVLYLTGHSAPGAVLLLGGPDSGLGSVLFAPERDRSEELWHGPRGAPHELASALGLDRGLPLTALDGELPEMLQEATGIHHRFGGDPSLDQRVIEALHRGRTRGARKGSGPRRVTDPGQVLDRLRMRKTPEEAERIGVAAALTVEGFIHALGKVTPGRGEWEIEAALEGAFRAGGAEGPAFASIVASGSGACVLHYTGNDRRMEAGELLLIDAGADFGFYAGDVTRTVPVSGTFSRDQEALYRVVLDAMRAAEAAVVPGAPADAPHRAAVARIAEGLVEVGILEGEAGEIEESGRYRAFFPHQTSHWLGLAVHDAGEYARQGVPLSLEEGMVLTIEPGLYLSPEMDEPEGVGPRWRRFLGMGIRLENDLLVTGSGHRNLTDGLALEPRDVERLLASPRSAT